MASVIVDGRALTADPSRNLLEVCLSHKLNLPYFCWHPALGSVGACRQCAVKVYRDEHDTKGRIAMACMTRATDGLRLSIDDEETRAFRAGVVELLMTNHPHDCPVCEEGGECHLQDMTVMTGHTLRRYDGPKRTFRNQDLGPFVGHEMNRCIACYRCVRFYGDYAGGKDLKAFAIRNQVYFGREADGVLESEFSGNLVEVCPTGVFFDRPFTRRYTRKWDLRSAPSICVHCGVGCNTHPNERYGELRRIVNRYHRDLNGWFLCDRGRFGYDFVNAAQRIRWPLWRHHGEEQRLDAADAAARLAQLCAEPGGVIGIGSPRASVEANFALRALVGARRFYAGVPRAEAALLQEVARCLQAGGIDIATVRDAEAADAVLVLGDNVPDTAPRLALALRQATRHRERALAATRAVPDWQDASVRTAGQAECSPFFVATVDETRLDDVATGIRRGAPADLVRLGAAILHALDGAHPAVAGMSADLEVQAATIADALRSARRPLVVCGTAVGDVRLIRLAAAITHALATSEREPLLSLVVPECNSVGLALFDAAGALEDAFDALHAGEASALVILENDLHRRLPKASVDAALARAQHVIALDVVHSATTARAKLVLPATTFAEGDGTLVNAEGRAQRFFQVLEPDNDFQPGVLRDSWRWLGDAARAGWRALDDVVAACARTMPPFALIRDAAPPAHWRIKGLKIARETHRASGRTAMRADRTVHEPKPPHDPDSALTFTMEGYQGRATPAALTPIFWAPGWNSEQATHRFQQEVNGPLAHGPAGVRLFDAQAATAATAPAIEIPPAFERRDGAFLLLPLDHVFGSDELSAHASAVAQRSVQPYVALNAEDAARLGVVAGEWLDVSLESQRCQLPLVVRAQLPRGVAGVPRGVGGIAWGTAAQWVGIAPAVMKA